MDLDDISFAFSNHLIRFSAFRAQDIFTGITASNGYLNVTMQVTPINDMLLSYVGTNITDSLVQIRDNGPQ